MSVILDVLKKQSHDDGKGDLNTSPLHYESISALEDDRPMTWPYWIVFLVFAHLVGLSFWAYYKLETNNAVEEHNINVQQNDEPSVPWESQLQPLSDEQGDALEKQTVLIIDFDQLPPHVRQNLPALSINAHVYSKQPRQRSIIINGRMLFEGMAVNEALLIEHIAKEHVILNFHGYRFRMPTLASS